MILFVGGKEGKEVMFMAQLFYDFSRENKYSIFRSTTRERIRIGNSS